MTDHDARRDRAQYDDLRRDTATELHRALRSVRDGTASLLQRLDRSDYLDEHDMNALDALVSAAVRAGRTGAALEALDRVNHLVPTGDGQEDQGDEADR